VVPVPIETPSGTRYKCPKCKKFMKPLSPQDVKEREAACSTYQTEGKFAPIKITLPKGAVEREARRLGFSEEER